MAGLLREVLALALRLEVAVLLLGLLLLGLLLLGLLLVLLGLLGFAGAEVARCASLSSPTVTRSEYPPPAALLTVPSTPGR